MTTLRPNRISLAALWILLCAVLNAIGWILSAIGWLNFTGYAISLLAAAAVCVAWWIKSRPTLTSGFRLSRFFKPLPLAFAAVAFLAILGGIIHPPANYDALAYRTPRVLHWLVEQKWHWIHTDFHRLNTRGTGFEWLTAPLIVFTRTDRLFFLINAVSLLLLPGFTFSILSQLGVRPRVAWHWMWLLPAGYCFLLQAGSIGNDLFGAAIAMAAFDFALRASGRKCVKAAWIAILAGGLMTAGKGFNLLLFLPLGLAIIPAIPVILSRPLPLIAVAMAGLLISLLPTALLNQKFSGDWKGLKAESVNLGTGEPGMHLAWNGMLIVVQNLTPTFFPISGVWNRTIPPMIPENFSNRLHGHFEKAGAEITLGEIQMEESAGLGFGVSLLLLCVVVRQCLPGKSKLDSPLKKPGLWERLVAPAFMVPAGALVAVTILLTQSGLGCPARYLAPFYILLLAPLLRLPSASLLLRRKWWRLAALATLPLAAVLLIVTPPRPLWPALTILKAMGADKSDKQLVKRAWTVYSVYADRSDGFAPVRPLLPPDLKILGFVGFDDPETSLWRPFGSRRIIHITQKDNAEVLKEKHITHVLIHESYIVDVSGEPLDHWLGRCNGRIVKSLDLSLRASVGPTLWHLVEIEN